MSTIRTSNNPSMLVWTREEVGYSLEQAAKAIGVSLDKLTAAESGQHSLTLNQLRKAAEVYDCPFGYFYLSEPPHEKSYKPVPDFRINPELISVNHFRLNLEMKKARDRRSIFIELSNNMEVNLQPFTIPDTLDLENIGSAIRNRLGILDSEISSLNYGQAYIYWKTKIENDGILVYESQYIPEASGVIGAAIYYDILPLILIKRGGNSNARKLFTLLHEYAHILMGESAINDSASHMVNTSDSVAAKLETKCNQLAAEILIPSEKVNISEYSNLNPVDKMEKLAKIFKVTYTTAAVCLKKMNAISDDEFLYLLDIRRNAQKEKQKASTGEVRIPREILMRLDFGRPMFNIVLAAYESGALDVFDASKILNLRVNKIDKLMAGVD